MLSALRPLLAGRAATALSAASANTLGCGGSSSIIVPRRLASRYKKKKKAVVVDERPLVAEAIEKIKTKGDALPNHSVHLHVLCKMERGLQPIRGTIILPNKVSKNMRILCFAEGPAAEAAKAAGADIVGSADLLEAITKDELQYDAVVSTPQCFPTVTKVARTLGPKGLMPNVKKGTVTDDVAGIIDTLKSSVRYTCGQHGDVSVTVGRVSFEPEKIEENVRFMVNEIAGHAALVPGKKKIKKKDFVRKLFMSATKGPGVPLRLTQFEL
ncbi:hypothetical protein RI367_004698 [Sorochytrium milnesiophthora]